MIESYDFLVVGAGIAGASVACRLAESSRTLLLEREDQPGYHTTGRSAAMFHESYAGPVVQSLTVASRTFYESPPDGFGDGPLLSPRGALLVAGPQFADRAAAGLADAQRNGVKIDAVGVEECLRLVPVLRPEQIAAALYEPGAMDMEVHAIHQGFLKGLRKHGGVVRTSTELLALSREPDGGWRATTGTGDVRCRIVVNAAGAWADTVAALAGARPIGLMPLQRTAFVFRPPSGVTISSWPMVIDLGEAYYFKPDAGRLLASPADEKPSYPHDVRPEDIDVALGIERIHAATTLCIDTVDRRWAGLRSFTRDRLPAVGFAPDVPGFFWLAGQGGFGIQTAPALSRIAAELAFGNAFPEDVARGELTVSALDPCRLLEGSQKTKD
ncbi:MAG: FAD-binding oxidoreductase [Pseudomonadota bacterium]